MSQSQQPIKLPSYRHHKASGQAFVHLSGKHVYLGPHGTKLSRDNYDRVVAEWLNRGRSLSQHQAKAATSIAVLLNGFRKSDVIPDSHRDAYAAVIKIMARLYGLTPADEFGAVALKVVRDEMVKKGWKRKTVNMRVHNVRRIFSWGVENQLVSPDGLIAMREVKALRSGKTTAPESQPIEAAEQEVVDACIAQMTTTPAAMVTVQMHTGMRAGELVIMRTADIDMSDPTAWVYRPTTHKTAHLGKLKEIALGPVAMNAINPLLQPDLNAFIFSPAKAEAERRQLQNERRKTPAGQGNYPGKNPVRRPLKAPGDRYDTPGYRQAIDYSIARAFPPPPELTRKVGENKTEWKSRLGKKWADLIAFRKSVHWSPHMLRHRFGTMVINQFTAEHAQRSLGHSNMKVTMIYAKLNLDKAKEVARVIG